MDTRGGLSQEFPEFPSGSSTGGGSGLRTLPFEIVTWQNDSASCFGSTISDAFPLGHKQYSECEAFRKPVSFLSIINLLHNEKIV